MSSTPYGNPNVTFSFQEYCKGSTFSQLLRNVVKPGIYDGGLLSKIDNSTIAIAPFTAALNVGDDKLVTVSTSSSFNLTVAEATPVLYMSFSWADSSTNYPDYTFRAAGAGPSTNEICLGTVIFSAGNVSSFNYTNRTVGLINNDSSSLYATGYLKFDATDSAYMYESSSGVITINDSINTSKINSVEFSGGEINIPSGGEINHNGTPIAGYLDNGTPFYKKQIDIGDWNMDSSLGVDVAHGLSDYKQIISARAIIRSDDDSNYLPLDVIIDPASNACGGSIYLFDTTNVSLRRVTGGSFDSTSYDSTSFNRGWIYIEYTI